MNTTDKRAIGTTVILAIAIALFFIGCRIRESRSTRTPMTQAEEDYAGVMVMKAMIENAQTNWTITIQPRTNRLH